MISDNFQMAAFNKNGILFENEINGNEPYFAEMRGWFGRWKMRVGVKRV